jgi:hypothetical protein
VKRIWFKPIGWIYYPVSFAGWVITIITLLLCVQFFVAIDRNSHSVSDTLINFFPYAVLFIMITGWIASKTSGIEKNRAST